MTWVNLSVIVLSEISQVKRVYILWFLLYRILEKCKINYREEKKNGLMTERWWEVVVPEGRILSVSKDIQGLVHQFVIWIVGTVSQLCYVCPLRIHHVYGADCVSVIPQWSRWENPLLGLLLAVTNFFSVFLWYQTVSPGKVGFCCSVSACVLPVWCERDLPRARLSVMRDWGDMYSAHVTHRQPSLRGHSLCARTLLRFFIHLLNVLFETDNLFGPI